MTYRTPQEWLMIFDRINDDQKSKNFSPEAPELVRIADRVISDLWGYQHNRSKYRTDDATSLANAVIAIKEREGQSKLAAKIASLYMAIPNVSPATIDLFGEPVRVDFTDEYKVKLFDRVRDLLYQDKDQC